MSLLVRRTLAACAALAVAAPLTTSVAASAAAPASSSASSSSGTITVAPSVATGAAAGTVAPARKARRTKVRVVTYNIRFGQYGIRNLARDIRRTGAEVVLLQEVDDRRSTGGRHQARALARRLGMNVRYDPNGTVRHGWKRGNAILSTYPIRKVKRWDLPRSKEQRGLMRARIDIGQRRLRVWVTHLEPGAGRLRQARAVRRRIGDPTCTTILGGDMNSTPRTREHRVLSTHLRDLWARVGDGPGHTNKRGTARIDYLFFDKARARSAWVAPLRHSDHRALVGNVSFGARQSC